MVSISHHLARRLESAEAQDGVGCVTAQILLDPYAGAICEPLAGGKMLFAGADSPLTHALGLGFERAFTDDDAAGMEEFFHSRGSAISVDVSPYADPSLPEILSKRHYRLSEFTTVLVRQIALGEQLQQMADQPSARLALPCEAEAYGDTVVRGFFGRDEVTAEERNLGRVLFAIPGTLAYFAEFDGVVAGCGQMGIHSGVATCFGDSTLVAYRRRGAHAAVIRARLAAAAAHGCDLITAGTLPGSVSQRDYERQGFHVAYTKATMVLD